MGSNFTHIGTKFIFSTERYSSCQLFYEVAQFVSSFK